MDKLEHKTPEVTPEVGTALTHAVSFAFSNPRADHFFDDVMARARAKDARRQSNEIKPKKV